MKHHDQVTLTHPSGELVDVDAGMARVITALWRRGIDTLASCEREHDGRAFILFASLESADRFAKRFTRRRAWEFSASWVSGRGAKGIRVGVRFPASEIAAVTKAVARAR